ncbi:MAG TPA: hypothetical protein VM123_10820 [archaeon]|nr:hypothetical protein [archaeon]
MQRILILPLLIFLGCDAGGAVIRKHLELGPAELFSGFLARNVRLDKGAVVLDARKITGEPQGLVQTDALDLLDPENRLITPDARPEKIEITCWARAPEGTRVELYTSCGDSYFSDSSWTGWEAAPGLIHTINKPGGRYLKVMIKLFTPDPENSPLVQGLNLEASYRESAARGQDSIEIKLLDNPAIVRSPVEFGYERPDQPAVREFVERNRLHELVAPMETEMDTMVAVLHWVARVPNTRYGHFEKRDYPWDIEEIVSYDNAGRPSIEGHCMSYAVAYITALTGLGYYARHWADQGFRFADHEVVEAWSNSLQKWIYFDPSLDHYYTDKASGEPLSILELHRVFVYTFFPEGETLRLPMDIQRQRVKALGGKNVPLQYVSGDYAYGRPNPDYDWGWFHGYLACGFMRLTTRNDFHSRKEPWFPHFGQGVHDFNWFLSWSDEKTPVSDKITLFSERERDFYWTLNQAQIKAKRAGADLLELEFGHSMPFFKDFIVSLDGGSFTPAGSTFDWRLHQGENSLAVMPRNEWGRTGIAARLTVFLY